MVDNAQEPPIVKTPQQARQGQTGHNVRIVLAAGIALALLGMGAAWLFDISG